jgi:ketosteroid isomerase-like protein
LAFADACGRLIVDGGASMNRRGLLAGASLALASGAAARADTADEVALRSVLQDFSDRVHARDPALADRVTPDFLLVGSEADERDRGRPAFAAQLARVYADPIRLSWTWDVVDGQVVGDLAWLLAQGWVVTEDPKGQTARKPYRLSGALVRRNGVWLWRMFHGSEPVG